MDASVRTWRNLTVYFSFLFLLKTLALYTLFHCSFCVAVINPRGADPATGPPPARPAPSPGAHSPGPSSQRWSTTRTTRWVLHFLLSVKIIFNIWHISVTVQPHRKPTKLNNNWWKQPCACSLKFSESNNLTNGNQNSTNNPPSLQAITIYNLYLYIIHTCCDFLLLCKYF